jgi:hypothetical protein
MYKITITYNKNRRFAYSQDYGEVPAIVELKVEQTIVQANHEFSARLRDDGKLLLRGIDVDLNYRNVDKVEIERYRPES